MSYSLHVAKKYEVRYANIEDFNNSEDEFKDLLYQFGINIYDNDAPWEIDKEEFKNMITALRNIDAGKFEFPASVNTRLIREDDVEFFEEISHELGCKSLTDLADRLEAFLKESDPNNDYIVFNYF